MKTQSSHWIISEAGKIHRRMAWLAQQAQDNPDGIINNGEHYSRIVLVETLRKLVSDPETQRILTDAEALRHQPARAETQHIFNGITVRVEIIDGMPWFIAKDVCEALEVGNHRQAVSRLDADERDGVTTNDAIGRPQETLAVNESGLYSLIFTSRKPEAKAFKKWVTSEVLPTIRKTGGYSIQNPPQIEAQREPLALTPPKFNANQPVSLNHYCRENGINLTHSQRISAGQQMSNYCRKASIDYLPPVGQGARYPKSVLQEFFS